MTDPTRPTDPSPAADPDGDPAATARMPLPGPPAEKPAPIDAMPWTPPPPSWSPPTGEPVAAATPPPATPPPASPAEPAAPPEAPPSGWGRQPPATVWRPARSDDGRGAYILLGLLLLAVGLWFFAEQTLGLELPNLRWSQLWPVILIVIGLWVVFGSRRQRR